MGSCEQGAGECIMHRSESQFCRDEAARLIELAETTADEKVRQHLIEMAREWLARANTKELKLAHPA
jgi:hypothetical protein